jgi:hypothetical protein
MISASHTRRYETGVNCALGDRTHGWGAKGKRIRVSRRAGRQENYSMLSAITVDGYIATRVVKGGANTATFNTFMTKDVLPQYARFPGPRSVIVMDNASIHITKASPPKF